MECTKFEQWAEFRAWIDKEPADSSVYWRGQRDPSWPLASSFERKILNMFGARSREHLGFIHTTVDTNADGAVEDGLRT